MDSDFQATANQLAYPFERQFSERLSIEFHTPALLSDPAMNPPTLVWIVRCLSHRNAQRFSRFSFQSRMLSMFTIIEMPIDTHVRSGSVYLPHVVLLKNFKTSSHLLRPYALTSVPLLHVILTSICLMLLLSRIGNIKVESFAARYASKRRFRKASLTFQFMRVRDLKRHGKEF